MKFLAVAALCVVSVLSDGGYEPSGWKPQGALLAQQTLYGPPPIPTTPTPENATTVEQTQDSSDLENINKNIMQRLRLEQGAEFGFYYVYSPDGRLQKVQYTTAPLRAQATSSSASNGPGSNQNNYQTNQQAAFGSHQVNTQSNAQSFGRFRGDYQTSSNNQDDSFVARQQAQSWSSGSPRNSNYRFTAPGLDSNAEEVPSKTSNSQLKGNYVASVQFSDVQPIPGPIYSFTSSPLVRIVRYAANYQ